MALRSEWPDDFDPPAPCPEIGAEEFRVEFTEEMRAELGEGLDALYRERLNEAIDNGAAAKAVAYGIFLQGKVGRQGLRQIARLHPLPWKEIKAPE